jgi:hypothetical protein
MFKYVVAFVVIMHGLAHVTGPLGFWGSGEQAFADKAWIFSQGLTAKSGLGRAFGFVWIIAIVGLVATGVGLLLGRDWWAGLAIAAAAVSLVAIVPWLKVVPPGAYAGALFDLLIIASLLSPWADRIKEFLS